MVILGITGPLCAGKQTAAQSFHLFYNFTIIQLSLENSDFLKENLKNIKKTPKENFVIYPITSSTQLVLLRTTYNFFLIGIDSPIGKRYRNYQYKYKNSASLETFLIQDDEQKFLNNTNECLFSSDRIIQNISSIKAFYSSLEKVDILNFQHIRPSPDVYYIRMTELVSSRSGCLQHRGGCILTNKNKIISTAYSGIPKCKVQCIDGGCQACFNQADQNCFCLHAEMTGIIEAKFKKIKNSTIYVKFFPCIRCAQAIISAKIVKIVFSNNESVDINVKKYLETAKIELKWVCLVV